jgi:tetratricopeptide (TPR) repeat protein
VRLGEPGRALEVLEEAIQQSGEDSQLLQALGAYYFSQADFGRTEQVYQQMLTSEPDQAAPYLALADLYLQRGRIGDAQSQYDHALALDPANTAVYLALGSLHQRLGQTAEAIDYYSQALSLNPTLDIAYVNLASLYRSQARWTDAQATYEQGLSVAPTSAQLLIQYGNFLLQRGDVSGALTVLDQAINLSAGAETFIARSDIYLSLGRVEEAKRDLQKAVEIEPGSVNAWISLGNLYSAQDDLIRAEQAYRQAVALSPGAATGYLSLADLAYDQGELDEAWRLYQTATRVEPASANPWVRLGQARSGQEDWAEAELAYRQAMSLSPLATEAYIGMSDVVWGSSANLGQALDWLRQADKPGFDLATVYSAMGDMYRQAGQSGLTADYFQKVVVLEPGSPEGYLALSELYLAQGLPWEAEHYATLALDVSPRSPTAYISLGDIYLALGDIATAEQNYQSARELDTTPTESYLSLADLYLAQGQYTQAIDAYQEALQLDPSNWSLLTAIGDVYLSMGESGEEDENTKPVYYDQALAAYQQAVEVAPEERSAWIALGTLYADVGENDAALSAFDQAAKLNPESPEPWLRKGDAYQAKGDVWAAQTAFEQARALSPDDTEPLLSLAGLFQEQGDLDTAERYAYQAIELDPLDAAGYITLGGILEDGSYTLSRFRRVLTDVDKAKAAAAYYWKAIQLNPRQIGIYRSWLNLQVDVGLRHRDLTPMQMALEELAHSPEAGTLQGHVALGLGYWTLEGPTDRAINHLQQAGVIDPEFADLYQQIARAYEERMDSRLAIDAWRRYVYAATATGSDTSEGLAHIAWLRGVRIEQPTDGANVSGPVQVLGAATREDFLFYTLEYTPVGQREAWVTIGEPGYEPVDYGLLGTWETGLLPAGDYLLRVKVVDTNEGYGPYDQVTVSVGSVQEGGQAESGPLDSAAPPASMLIATTPAPILSPPTGEFTLLHPLSIEEPSNGQIDFEWEWTGDVPPGSGFEVRVWREGEPPYAAHNSVLDNRYGLIEDLGGGRYRLSMDISAAAGVRGRASIYFWTVALVQIDPAYADLGLQAEPARLRYDGGGAVDHIEE